MCRSTTEEEIVPKGFSIEEAITRQFVLDTLKEFGFSVEKDVGNQHYSFRIHITGKCAKTGQSITVVGYRAVRYGAVKDIWREVHLYLLDPQRQFWTTPHTPFNGGCSGNVVGRQSLREVIGNIVAGKYLEGTLLE